MEAGTSLLLGTTELPAEQEPRDSSLDSPVPSRASREFTSTEHCYMPLLGACPFICPSSSSPCSLGQAALLSSLPTSLLCAARKGRPPWDSTHPKGPESCSGIFKLEPWWVQEEEGGMG